MKRPVYNGHSAAQISQKARWMNLGMIGAAKGACTWIVSHGNKFRETDPEITAELAQASQHLQRAFKLLMNRKPAK